MVLQFLSKRDIESFIDKDGYSVIQYFLKKVAFSQPEVKLKSELSGIQITKEFLEDWIAQACNLTKIGAGNYPIDVYSPGRYGVDVKFVTTQVNKDGSFKDTQSNETSLGQNFKGSGLDLDQDFSSKKYEKILKGWIKILEKKMEIPMREHNLNKIYYFIFLRAGNKISLAITLVNHKEISKLSTNKSSDTSVFVQNFVDDKYGRVKIYKSKKRMELRLLPKKLDEDNMLITWDFDDLYPDVVSLREVAKSKRIDEHSRNQFKKFFK